MYKFKSLDYEAFLITIMSKLNKLTETDIYIISGLAHGATVKELRKVLKYYKIQPRSESSIDKALNALRKKCNCRANTELVYKMRDKVIDLNMDVILYSR